MQLQILDDINWTLIISLVAGSAILAYLGDVLGSKYGKQRISIFGLRPRSTSRLITALTGVFISVVILTVMAFFSQNIRAMLFRMTYITQQLRDLSMNLQKTTDQLDTSREQLEDQRFLMQTMTASLDITRLELDRSRNDRDLLLNEKNDLEASVVSLREEAEELQRELEVRRLETITVPAGSLLAQKVILPHMSRVQVLELVTSLDAEVHSTLETRFVERRMPVSGDITVAFDPMEESDFILRATDSPDRLYVRALAAENIARGEHVNIHLEWNRSYLLYNKGEILYRKLVDPEEPNFNAEQELHIFLRELRNSVSRSGVLPDPATNTVGSLEGEDFFEVVEKLKSFTTPVIINATALEDIYTEGPVRIKIELE